MALVRRVLSKTWLPEQSRHGDGRQVAIGDFRVGIGAH
jgi:hypothetical protein